MMSTISRRNTQQIATTQNDKNDYRIQELHTGYSNSNYNSNLALSFKIHGELVFKLEKAMAPHSSTLAWKIPWMEPGGLQSTGSQRVGHD